jgi:ribosomal protein S18 acetylase RimI-like enzyme
MIISQAEPKDISSIVWLHTESLPASICDLTALGKKVLNKFYKSVIKDNLGYICIAEENNEIIGFCLITKDSRKLFKQTLSVDFMSLINTVFLSNKVNFFKVSVKKILFRSLITDSRAQLIYIGVSQASIRQGVGQKLLNHIENKFREWKITEYTLDVEKENLRARGFYMKNKFVTQREYFLGAKKKFLLKKYL